MAKTAEEEAELSVVLLVNGLATLENPDQVLVTIGEEKDIWTTSVKEGIFIDRTSRVQKQDYNLEELQRHLLLITIIDILL